MSESPQTGVPEIDDALRYNNPVSSLTEYFRERMATDRREAVIADLAKAQEAMPEGSPAHDNFKGWREALERGENPFDAD